MFPVKIFARNFRGFRNVEVDLGKVTFLVGDNSSGKSSILHLVDAVLRSDLNSVPQLNEELGVSEYDYFSPYSNYSDVTFGYSIDKGAGKFSKIITTKRASPSKPVITHCSYQVDNVMITLRKV